MDALYGQSNIESTAQFYLTQIREAQQFAPFADERGLVASVLQADLVPAYEQCLSTPFQCIASRIGLAATTWAIAADLNINPFLDPIGPAPGAFGKISPANGTAQGIPGAMTLTWQRSARAMSYEYCYDLSDDGICSGSWVSTTAANATISVAGEFTKVFWQVRARNAAV